MITLTSLKSFKYANLTCMEQNPLSEADSRSPPLGGSRWIESTPSYLTSLRSTLMLSSHLYFGAPPGFFPPGFPTKIIYAFLISLVCYTSPPSHPPVITQITFGQSPHYPVFSILLSLPHSSVQIFSLATCFQTPSICVLPLVGGKGKDQKLKLSLCFNWAPRHEDVLGKWRCSSMHSLTSALDWGEWSAPPSGRLTPEKEPLVSIG